MPILPRGTTTSLLVLLLASCAQPIDGEVEDRFGDEGTSGASNSGGSAGSAGLAGNGATAGMTAGNGPSAGTPGIGGTAANPGGGTSGSGGAAPGGSSTGGSAGSSTGGTSTGGKGGSSVGGTSTGGKGGSSVGGTSTGGKGSGGASGKGGAGGGPSGGGSGGGAPGVGECNVFPSADPWNKDISQAAVDATWTSRIHALVGDVGIHPDYGVDGDTLYGIPINVVPATQALVPVTFDAYEDESDPGPYPFPGPGDIEIEGQSPTSCDSDCHVLVVQNETCMLYEAWACEHASDGWHCANGAKWDLKRVSYGQRPEGWTSSDAAGLPVLSGLVRYDEVRSGEIRHAIRFTLPCTGPNYVAPATHHTTSCDDPDGPPMGIRMRLRADFDDSALPASARVVVRAMKRYGLILADNGQSFFFQGEAHPGWTDDDIAPLKDIPASAFEAVDVPPLEP